ncbi:MAG TPA: universal stress protein [Nitrospiraceae bacterium]|nr:universal stress protein [Nitrospiraceae bacterium]
MEENPVSHSLPPSLPPHMPTPTMTGTYKIFHPTDLSAASDIAFAHALKLALAAHGELRIMHVDPDIPETDWSGLPRVRDTLAKWGVLPSGSSKGDVGRLGLHIEKILAYHEEPTRSLEQHLKRHPADLLVLTTHQPDVLERLMTKSVAEPLARHTRIPTLFIPEGTHGFVALDNGQVHLRTIVIPVSHTPPPHAAIQAAIRLVQDLQSPLMTVTLLYVGLQEEMPVVNCIDLPGLTWRTTVRTGDIVDAITTDSETADLVIMATEGHHGLFDALLGSTTERVLRQVRCPLLAIPVD